MTTIPDERLLAPAPRSTFDRQAIALAAQLILGGIWLECRFKNVLGLHILTWPAALRGLSELPTPAVLSNRSTKKEET